jgi:hypothetical protein
MPAVHRPLSENRPLSLLRIFMINDSYARKLTSAFLYCCKTAR